jgi:hypothetical protein
MGQEWPGVWRVWVTSWSLTDNMHAPMLQPRTASRRRSAPRTPCKPDRSKWSLIIFDRGMVYAKASVKSIALIRASCASYCIVKPAPLYYG